MANVKIDASLCTGCGLCASNCPEIFEMGDDNIAKVRASSCSEHDVHETASQCPVEAIIVSD